MIRRVFQVILFAIVAYLIFHGLTGPQFAPKNLATLFTWIHFRFLLIITIILAGNYFCSICPMMLWRNILRKWVRPQKIFPKKLRTKYLGSTVFIFILFAYEWMDFWSSPFLTALLLAFPFILITVIDLIYKKANFCKYICPIGQFNFVTSLVSPTEVKIKEQKVCDSCTSYECLHGNPDTKYGQIGCELDLFLPQKIGNMDCTFCMECIYACPEKNVQVQKRVSTLELTNNESRAGIGRLFERNDILYLLLVFTFSGLLNAFAMTGPAYQWQELVGELWGLITLFLLFCALLPWPILKFFPKEYISSGVPLAVSIWLAHYSFHFFTGIFTFVPILFSMIKIEVNFPLAWMGMRESLVSPIENIILAIGLLYSFIVTSRAKRIRDIKFVVWIFFLITICSLAIWVMNLPMEMRGVIS